MIKLILGFSFKHTIHFQSAPKKLLKFDGAKRVKVIKSVTMKLPNLSTQNWSCWSFPGILGSWSLLEKSDPHPLGVQSRLTSKWQAALLDMDIFLHKIYLNIALNESEKEFKMVQHINLKPPTQLPTLPILKNFTKIQIKK